MASVEKIDGEMEMHAMHQAPEPEDRPELVLKLAGPVNRLLSVRQIRRDYSIKQQLYFVSWASFDILIQRPCIHIRQAIANSRTKEIEARKILEFWMDGNRKMNKKGSREYFNTSYCALIDEVSKRFYFLNSCDQRFNIAIYELSFAAEEDNFGYRKITAKRTPRNIAIEQNSTVILRSNLFLVTQSNGQLITTCSSISDPRCHMAAVIKFSEDGLGASILPGKGKFKARDKKVIAETIMISPLGYLVVAFSSETNIHMFVCSYNNKLELLKCLKIDKLGLLKDCGIPIPEQVHQDTHFLLLGRVRKYTIFLFGNMGLMMLAHRWPKDWYTHSQPPEVREWFSSVTMAPLSEENFVSSSGHLVGNDLCCLFASEDGHTLTRSRLGQELKDYRCCNHCGLQETHKRKNKHGKRIADFKVCRVCKEKNLHVPYCSFECIKKDWKEHKTTHK